MSHWSRVHFFSNSLQYKAGIHLRNIRVEIHKDKWQPTSCYVCFIMTFIKVVMKYVIQSNSMLETLSVMSDVCS